MTPAQALEAARAMLVGRGFVETARNERGDSFYLRPPGASYGVRISSHRRTARRRRQYPDTLVSLVLDRPIAAAELERRVAAILRDFASRAAALEDGRPADGDSAGETERRGPT